MSRMAERSDLSEVVRLRLLEKDQDEFEADLSTGLGELRSELAKIKGVLLGILVSVTTAALLLAINLVVSNGA